MNASSQFVYNFYSRELKFPTGSSLGAYVSNIVRLCCRNRYISKVFGQFKLVTFVYIPLNLPKYESQ